MVDIIWLFVMWGIWTKKLKHNSAWNNFSYLHYFVLFLAVVNIIVKVSPKEKPSPPRSWPSCT